MSYDDYVIYKAAPACTCDLCLLAARLDAELAARRAVVAAANDKQLVPIVKAVRVCARCSRPHWDRPGSVSDACVCGERLTVLVSAATHQATCPTCGQLMPASTTAQPAPTMPPAYDASGARGVVPSPPKKTYESWRDREPLL